MIRIWKINYNDSRRIENVVLKGHKKRIICVDILSNGRIISYSDGDAMLIIWI